jgi:cell division protein FtsN
MAQKDYVKRKPASRKKASAKQQPAPTSTVAKFKVTLAICVLIAFGVGIYWLGTIEDVSVQQTQEVTAEETLPTHEVIESSIDAKDPLPELPEEEFKFFAELPGYEVKVDVEAIESDKRYLMQCGSFRAYGQADEMRAKMAFVGLEPQIRGSQNGWYRVVLGPYTSKRRAEKDRHTLQRTNINSCQIWLWNL